MEYIDENIGDRGVEEILESNGVLYNIDEYGKDTSLYSITLLDSIKDNIAQQMYINSSNGKVYSGAVKCKYTRQKDKISPKNFLFNVIDLESGEQVFQIMYKFDSGEIIDARGYYARTALKAIVKKNYGRNG